MSEELLTHFLGQMENKQSILKQTYKVAQIGDSLVLLNGNMARHWYDKMANCRILHGIFADGKRAHGKDLHF